MGRRFSRHLDLAAIERVRKGVKPTNRAEGETLKRQKPPRAAASYRAARRNDVLRGAVKGVWPSSATGALGLGRVRANRSRKWPPFKGRLYAEGAR